MFTYGHIHGAKSSFLETEESKRLTMKVDLQNTREQADFALRPSGRQESRPNPGGVGPPIGRVRGHEKL
jgi:hypothetical protein